ncbi:hypothetical protein JNK13_06050 [bacterium]|nr:hypothetical protein [bacterium]
MNLLQRLASGTGLLSNNIDQLCSWFGDFSQGKGTDGEKLMQDCPGDCSPQYYVALEDRASSLEATCQIVCGHARDRDDGIYNLKSAVIWNCEV